MAEFGKVGASVITRIDVCGWQTGIQLRRRQMQQSRRCAQSKCIHDSLCGGLVHKCRIGMDAYIRM